MGPIDIDKLELKEDRVEKQEEFTKELNKLMLKEVTYKDGSEISFHQRKVCIAEAIKRTYETLG